MKTYIRLFIFLLAFMGLSSFASAYSLTHNSREDSITVYYGKKGRITIVVSDSADRAKLKSMDMNAVVSRAMAIMDSSAQYDKVIIKDSTVEYRVERERSKFSINIGVRTGKDTKNKDWTVRDTWNIDMGLNNWLRNGSTTAGTAYELDPLRSRYFAISNNIERKLGKNSPFRLIMGLQLSWYNFMFENTSTRVEKTATGIEFNPSSEKLSKSKLVVTYLNVPMMLRYHTPKDKFSIGMGGYVGYKIDSYNAYKVSGQNRKQRDHSNFYLNNFRYGVSAEIKIADVQLFGNYDLNDLFIDGKGPALTAFTFGVRW